MLKVITIAQQKGGSGKTTIAAHLAAALAAKNKKTALADVDPQASLSKWHNLRELNPRPNKAEISLISSAGWRIESSVQNLRHKFDYLIIDSPPHTQTESKSAIRCSDLIIVPMQASPTDLWATETTIKFASNIGKTTRIVLNRFNPLSKLGKQIKASSEDNFFDSYLGNRSAFGSCFLSGSTVLEDSPKSQAAQEVLSLADEVLEFFSKRERLS